MEVGRNLLSSSPSFPPKTHLRNSLSSYSSSSSCSSSASASTSVLLLEQRDDFKALLRLSKEDKISQGVLNKRQIESEPSVVLDEKSLQDLWELDRPSTHWPDSLHVTQSPPRKDINDELSDAIALAKKALMASKEAASIEEFFEDADSCSDDDVDEIPLSLASSVGKESETVKSTRLFERRSKRRKSPKSTLLFPAKQTAAFRTSEVRKKVGEGVNSGDPIRFFLAGPESKQLLTSDEESQLIGRVQDLMKLEQVKARVQSEIGREPTLVEWAEALGLSCRNLRAQIRSGASAREKLVYSNLRMVVHVAKQYRGRGLGIQDLMQEGSMGLMRSVEKFKPQAGCRFASYAYWWIRQTIRKAIFQHSRTIRISENMYTLLGKVSEAKKSFRREGNHKPLHEDVAERVGISNEKLAKLLFAARTPLSMQQTVWADQNVTFQEVTADTSIEIPDTSVTKQLMRKQVRGLLRILDPRDQRIIELRFGIEDGQRKSLSEIGTIYGLTKERVRQLESRALSKLKERFIAHDFNVYSDVLM